MSDWTLESLRHFLETRLHDKDLRDQQRFDAQEKAVAAQIDSARQETRKTEAAMEKRFESVNEFRAQLSDQSATFMPRNEAQVLFEAQAKEIAALRDRINDRDSRQRGLSDGAKLIASIVGFAVTALSVTTLIIKLSGR